MTSSEDNDNEVGLRRVTLPKASPDENAEKEASKLNESNNKRKWFLTIAGAIALGIVVGLCVAIPVAVTRSKRSTGSETVKGSTDATLVQRDALPLFENSIIENVYETTEELQASLYTALERHSLAFIERNGIDNGFPFADDAFFEVQVPGVLPEVAESVADSPVASASQTAFEDVNDYETNVQEENVDEADIVKADANFVYAAYGDYIVVWDTEGNQVAQVSMPPIALPSEFNNPVPDVSAEPPRARTSFAGPGVPFSPKPNIQGLLLTDSHLIAIVAGYYNFNAGASFESRVLLDYQASRIQVYRKTPQGDLTFVASKDINGHYIDARSVKDTVHLFTGSGINLHRPLLAALERSKFKNTTEEEYIVQAKQIARSLLPDFAKRLTDEITVDGTEPPIFLPINQWATEANTEPNATADYMIPRDTYNVISNLAQITSFKVNDEMRGADLVTSSSAFLAPSFFNTLYGTEDNLILATSGWDWDPAGRESIQKTYLVALKTDNSAASTSFQSVGSLPGALLGQYALDVHNSELRAATTVERNRRWWWGPIRPLVEPQPLENAELTTVSSERAELPVVPPPPVEEPSRTENFMSVLKLDVDGRMEPKGSVKIGEKHERITAVRFFDDVAYAVTFERTDPFYVLDMSVPKVLGELKLPGFSSYLHSMNDDNTLLVAVGQNATGEGRVLGLMVTVFDATNPADPLALVSHTFEQSEDVFSGSSAEWDFKSFRYLAGKLIIPLEIWQPQEWNPVTQQFESRLEGAEDFVGFTVLDVSTTAISESYRVSHMRDSTRCYYCGGFLPSRSLVYAGDLMTIRDNVVVSTDLATGAEAWRFDVNVEGEPAECGCLEA